MAIIVSGFSVVRGDFQRVKLSFEKYEFLHDLLEEHTETQYFAIGEKRVKKNMLEKQCTEKKLHFSC